MNGSVLETVLVCLMLVRLSPLAFARNGIVTGVSLVGGSGPHEGTVQVVGVADDGSQLSLVTLKLHLRSQEAIAICKTLGYPGVNRIFHVSPYLADDIAEPGFDLRCPVTPSLVTSEPDEQEATTHALHPSPDPADTTPADTTQEPDGDSSFSTSVGNSVQNAGEGARVGAVIFTIMAGVNVYGYEWTRK